MITIPVDELPNSPARKRRKSRALADGELEHDQQRAVIAWADDMAAAGIVPDLSRLFAIPNGGQRSKAAAGKLKAEGLRAGVPDLCLPISRGGYLSLWIEMKAGDNVCSDEQEDWQTWLVRRGHFVVTCWSADQAIDTLTEYLDGKHVRTTK